MFVPSTRLIWLTALVGVPVALALGMTEIDVVVLGLAGAVVALLVLMDAVLSAGLSRHLTVTLPDVVHTTKAKRFELSATVNDPTGRNKRLRLGLAFPAMLEADGEVVEVTGSKSSKTTSATWKVLAADRGSHTFDTIYTETPSFGGLWDIRRAIPVQCEVRAYPDLSREKNVLAPLFFRKGSVGTHQVRQVGRGREFEQLRPYLPGDSYDDVYWKGTAKRRFPVTMMYQIERTQELHVILDISRRSARPLEASARGVDAAYERFLPRTQCERFIQAALVLALAAEQQADRFGLTAFSDQVHTIVPAGSGRAHYDACRNALYALQPRQVSPDFQDLFIHVGNRLRHRSLVIILTDLGEPWLSETFSEAVTQAAKRHVVLVHTLGSREFQPLFAKDSAIHHADELYSRLAGHVMWNDLQVTMRQLKQAGVHLTTSNQEGLIADVVTAYLNTKRRQLL
jgi:uncharacterized protein (DUF58 family)